MNTLLREYRAVSDRRRCEMVDTPHQGQSVRIQFRRRQSGERLQESIAGEIRERLPKTVRQGIKITMTEYFLMIGQK